MGAELRAGEVLAGEGASADQPLGQGLGESPLCALAGLAVGDRAEAARGPGVSPSL